jgi:NOL1/NOP2/fmu family ribosome biogenesis protein
MVEKLQNSFKKDFISKIQKYYSFNFENYLKDKYFYKTEKGKIYLSNFNLDELKNVDLFKISSLGMYFGTLTDAKDIRLSIEASNLIAPKKNYVLLKSECFKKYLSGKDLDISCFEKSEIFEKSPFYIVKYEEYNLGVISIKENYVYNFIPKSRRVDEEKLF